MECRCVRLRFVFSWQSAHAVRKKDDAWCGFVWSHFSAARPLAPRRAKFLVHQDTPGLESKNEQPVDYPWFTCVLPVQNIAKLIRSLSFNVLFYPRSFLKCSIKCQMFEKFEETQANLQQLHSESRDPHGGTTMFGSCKSHAISKQDISWCQNRLAEWFKWAVAKCYRWHVQRTTKACSYSWNLA